MQPALSPAARRFIAFLVGTNLLLCGACLGLQTEVQGEETRELVLLVQEASEVINQRGIDRACSEFQSFESRWFQGESYVFVLAMDGEAICHPAQPNLHGKSLLELRDPHGKPIVQNFLQELSDGDDEGWVHYLWPKPGETTFFWKSTYVRRVFDEDTEYIVGSGLYSMKMERFFVVEQVEDASRLISQMGTSAFSLIKDRSSGFRFLDAYIFVMSFDGIQQINLGFPELEGVNLLDFQDSHGKLVSREMLRLLEGQPAGWVEYMWPKPGEGLPSRKSSYVRLVEIEDQRYVVGAGVYLEQ